MRKILFSFLLASLFTGAIAQAPQKYNASQVFEQLKKLDVLGSVLYIAAHPDDENTRLLTYLANEKLYRTGYLSLTRGDGGQNLIGDEQGVELGLIRTQELLAARRIDGAEQFFSRAYDFGYSKSPEETFQFWDKQKILSDVVWVIRKFRPDIIIARFPTTGEGGHGHHTASAILAGEAFDAAGDPTKFPEQFKYGVTTWQPKRLLWNTFNFGSVNTESADQFKIDVGGYNALLGESYGEIAAESRSQHKSQGFGVYSSRGSQLEYFKTIKGPAPTSSLMDGVLTNWDRLNAKSIETSVQQIIKNYSFDKPQQSIPALLAVYQSLQKSKLGYWGDQKLKDIKSLLKECMGLYMEATTQSMFAVQGDSVAVNFVAINRSGYKVDINSVSIDQKKYDLKENLPFNTNVSRNYNIPIPLSAPISQPYWLVEPMTQGNFTVNNQELIGKPQNDPKQAVVSISINGVNMDLNVPIMHKSNDPVKGEQYDPFYIIPKIELKSESDVALSINKAEVPIKVHTFLNNDKGEKFSLKTINSNNVLTTDKNGETYYSIKNPDVNNAEIIKWNASLGGQVYDSYKKVITYSHIPPIVYFPKASTKLVAMDLKIEGNKIGYLPGAGDKIPEALQQMGYKVSILSSKDLLSTHLAQYDAIITGVRAYNIHEWLNDDYPELMKYVYQGGVLLVQYNTNNNIGPVKAKIGPYPFTISRNRVTNENAAVTFLQPDNVLMNYPNKITQQDFSNWIQERSTYHATDYEKEYQALFSMNDAGEPAQPGSLIYTNYGKGRFVYSGLVFFRELPAGVPGAYRLFANLIANKK